MEIIIEELIFEKLPESQIIQIEKWSEFVDKINEQKHKHIFK